MGGSPVRTDNPFGVKRTYKGLGHNYTSVIQKLEGGFLGRVVITPVVKTTQGDLFEGPTQGLRLLTSYFM